MRYLIATALAFACSLSAPQAFELDGYSGGMKQIDAVRRLTDQGLDAKISEDGGRIQIHAGTYEMTFCEEKIFHITGYLTVKHYNELFLKYIALFGQPKVEILAPDEDMLWLRWHMASESYALNSGMDVSGARYHVITMFDNDICKK